MMVKELDIMKSLTEGWEMFKANTNTLVALTIVMVVVSMVISYILPFGGMLVTGPFMGAVFLPIIDINSGESFDMKRIFEAVVAKILHLFVAGIVIQLFTMVGTFLVIIPGVLVTGWYMFTYMYILDRDMDFWGAMEASRQLAFTNQVGFFLFAVAIIALNIAGLLALGVGILVTIPVSLCAVFKAYCDVVGLVDDPATRSGNPVKVMTGKPQVKVTPPPPPPPSKK